MTDPLTQLAALAGRERYDGVTIARQPPALATRFQADEAAAAVIAATAAEAADLWRMRTGQTQTVEVAAREAAASLISFMFQRFEDPARAAVRDPPVTAADGFFRSGDGRWVYLHPSFPESSRAMLQLLGCENSREAVTATVAGWEAQALEDAIAEAGVCGAMARTPQEWDASEQGQAMARLPLVEVVRIGDAPPKPLPASGDSPLSGVKVLDLTRVLAGPACARALAQHGAEVLHITSPNLPSIPPFVSDTGHGKRSAFLDLKTEADHGRLLALLDDADIFSQGYRLGGLDRLGLSPEALAARRPGLIHVSINCYGHEGPWAGRPGWEQLAQTVTGMAHVHGGEAGPTIQPAAVNDYTTGYLAALGAMIALRRRAVEGGSWRVRVSLVQTARWVRELGIAGPERLAAVQPFSAEELAGYSLHEDGGFGPVSFLRPPVRLSATPARWTEPTRPLGSDPPAWV
ncbi:crotonobetainyl-CoA:carnitine CoA-transferase CaiB-like acyl-CoA transferase [Caulobacter ginsengisoli]|uniref:Crotonobetainyl-CoA:carnitine CoA-transferase CaiB-like acyl-CoA transferase n=1 Tax=Caulobacter ginsengisoli TaxID=400775 RepID=A0ABU0IXJ0_9CAUL|nr:CoA transferase [Caulobacter ginsengisoli]MDQ0466719.1 crotonobetainyl-CoA:carnitine CoA-transferase CaiB-like acyl-CoA transferase [Caulobacter ginsengisoli]